MYSLPCPACEKPIEVSASKAGQEVACPHCQTTLSLPKLGDLRKLQRTEETGPESKSLRNQEGASAGKSIAFVVFGLIATGCLLIAGFCGIRWYLIEVPGDSAKHVQTMADAYQNATAAELIVEYENMEKVGIEVPSPYSYKVTATVKKKWGFNALVAAGIGAIAIAGAGIAASRR